MFFVFFWVCALIKFCALTCCVIPDFPFYLLVSSSGGSPMKHLVQREAAVAIIVVKKTVPAILVLKRNDNPQDPWSGHYAFPGGRRDTEDSSLLSTCLRETFEECSIRLSAANLVKRYPMHRAGNHLHQWVPVTAFLFELDKQPPISLQRSEIRCYEWLDLEYLSNRENVLKRPLVPGRPEIFYPCIPATDGFVWGFTFDILLLVINDYRVRRL